VEFGKRDAPCFGSRPGANLRPLGITLIVFAMSWLVVPAVRADLDDIRFRISADGTYDNNLTRAQGQDVLYDSFATVTAGATLPLGLGQYSRLVLSANAGAERFDRYTLLDRSFIDGQGELQFRSSGQFSSPIWGLLAKIGADQYKSELRDGYRATYAVTLRAPVTDRLFVFGALAYNTRDGRSKVFDTKDASLRGHVDYSLGGRHTIYAGLEGRYGDVVSVARPSLAFLDIADAIVVDDAFIDTPRLAYRFKASTAIGTIGYNVALGERLAFDLAYRYAHSRPDDQPPAGVAAEPLQYTIQQGSASLLFRF